MADYVIRLKGDLSSELTDAFPSLTADREPAQTVLHGDLDDQAALAGLLNHLDILGVAIVGVLQVPPIRGNGRRRHSARPTRGLDLEPRLQPDVFSPDPGDPPADGRQEDSGSGHQGRRGGSRAADAPTFPHS